MSSAMNRIVLEAVPAAAMRPPYDQEVAAGDWFVNPDGDLVIRAIGGDLDNPHVFLFALHELVEAMLCRARGVTQDAVDRFDRAFDDMQDIGPDDEPGDHPAAPYRNEHRFAMLIEHLVARELGLAGYGTVK